MRPQAGMSVAVVAVLAVSLVQTISLCARDGSSSSALNERFAAARARLGKFGLLAARGNPQMAKADLPALDAPRFAASNGGADNGTRRSAAISQRYSITWDEVLGASGYQWQLWNGKSCRGYLVSAGVTPASQLGAVADDFLRPITDGDYFWRVRALGDGIARGNSPWSCGAAFQIGAPGCSGQQLGSPTGLTADGQSCGAFIQTSDNHPTLQWGTVASASGYSYEVWTAIDCTGTLAASGTTDAATNSASLSYLEDGTYFWRTKATGDGSSYCDSQWSTTCSFTVGAPLCGGTLLSSPDIASLTEWSLSGSPYIISGQLLVETSGTLIIDAGVIVKFASGASAQINGTLAVNGTDSSRVVFGSLNDNSLCGPSPGGSGNPQPGDWSGVTFTYTSNLTGAYWTIRHASTGFTFDQAVGAMVDNLRVSYCQNGISVQYSTITFTNTLVELCSGTYGVNSDCLGDFSSFTNLDLHEAPLLITANSQASFTGGTWDGGGMMNIGTLDYSQGTPDPSFSGITLQNPPPGTPAALTIMGQVTGTTHWQGIPFLTTGGGVGPTGVVYASNTTLYSQGAAIDVQGQFYLGQAGTTTTATSDQPGWTWQGIVYEAGSSGNVTNSTIEDAYMGITISTSGSFSCSDTLIRNCLSQGLKIQAGGTYTFTNLNLLSAALYVMGDCHPSFTGGTWDGGGMMDIGTLDYSQGTPDPSFSGITIQNPLAGNPPALAIVGQVAGTTHWQGIPFWIMDGRIGTSGVVSASNTTLYSQGYPIDVQGQFYLGATGATTTATSVQPGWTWQGIIYEAGSSGNITNSTIEDAYTGITISTSGSFSCNDTLIRNCQYQGLMVQAAGAYTFTNINLTSAPLYITGNCHPSFTGGTWDGSGVMNMGTLDYSQGTPDPAFSNITIQNPPPGNPPALAIMGQVTGTTHWRGIPFWIQGASIGVTGIVSASNTTLYSQGYPIDVQGRLYLGRAGTTTTATDVNGMGWQGIMYEAGSSGIVSYSTISRANSAITVATSGGVLLADDVISSSQAGLVTLGDGAPLVERTVFAADNGIGVSVQGNAAPDLGGGALNSPGYNTLLGTTYAVQNLSTLPVSARSNWWGCAAEAEMDAGLQNVTAIYDHADDGSLGIVDYSGWLGSKNRVITVSRQNSDILLTWPQEPTGTLTIFKGTDPSQMTSVGIATGASWRDSGAITDPSPLLFYRVDGPCQ